MGKAIDELEKMCVSGGSDRYIAGTYKLSDGTLPAMIGSFTVSENAVVSGVLREWRFNKYTNSYGDCNYVPKFINNILLAGEDYYFQYPIVEITIASGVLLLNFLPSDREAGFVDPNAPTTTGAPVTTTTAIPTTGGPI